MSEVEFEFGDPATWDIGHWVLIVPLSFFPALLLTFEPNAEEWGSPGHQLSVGLFLVEVAAVLHIVAYPETVLWIPGVAAALATYLWSFVPTIYWEPWYVTSSIGLVGLVPLGNGLRHAFTEVRLPRGRSS